MVQMKKRDEKRLEEAVETIKELDKAGKVQFIILYGSLSEGRENELSDIDLAVNYDGNEGERFEFRVRISGELPNDFDVQIFQDLPLYVQKEVLNGDVLFYRDYDYLFDTFLQTARKYEDFQRHLETYYSSLEGAEVGGKG